MRGGLVVSALGLGMLSLAAPVFAQAKVEVGLNVGYTASEGVSTDQVRLGQTYNTLTPVSGASFDFTFGVFLTEHAEAEFLWARQSSRLDAEGAGPALQISELTLYNYMGNFIYNWGEHDSKARPYFMVGAGATQYSFGSLIEQAPPGTATPKTSGISGDTRFATNIGAGLKYFFSPHVGANVGFRYTPTYITSTQAGVWCDPWYGCWPIANAHYANQFDTSFGVTVRFD